jgi:hypothetical protein
MPWRPEPMKDVAKLRKASDSRLADYDPGVSESGNRPGFISWYLCKQKGTQGTETSKYLQERKENSTPIVAASEVGRAQTDAVPRSRPLLYRGSGTHRATLKAQESYKSRI